MLQPQSTPGRPRGQSRYTGPSARAIAERLPGSRPEGQGWRLRGLCHGHGDVTDSASLQIRDSTAPEGGLWVKCWANCPRHQVIASLEEATDLRIWSAWEDLRLGLIPPRALPDGPKTAIPRPAGAVAPDENPETSQNPLPRGDVNMLTIARRTWERDSMPIPADPDHPARRWLATRQLWRPGFPVPGSLRWLPVEAHYQGHGPHTGAGSLIALAAPPEAWAEAWPELPNLQAVQLIAVDRQGSPALDRPADAGGLGKRSLGPTTGAIVVFGCPVLAEALAPVRVAEGVADALALASRYPGPAVATLGTSTMAEGGLPKWLASSRSGAVIHVDADAGGEGAARQLRRRIHAAGSTVTAVLPALGKDAAEAAAELGFAPLPEGWTEYAATLRDTTSWPRWEIARQAVNLLSEVEE